MMPQYIIVENINSKLWQKTSADNWCADYKMKLSIIKTK